MHLERLPASILPVMRTHEEHADARIAVDFKGQQCGPQLAVGPVSDHQQVALLPLTPLPMSSARASLACSLARQRRTLCQIGPNQTARARAEPCVNGCA